MLIQVLQLCDEGQSPMKGRHFLRVNKSHFVLQNLSYYDLVSHSSVWPKPIFAISAET